MSQEDPQHGTKRTYPSGKVLGGGSSINAMCYVRGQIRDYAAWQDAVGDTGKWSYEDLPPVFIAQEDNDTFHDGFHGIDGGLAVQLPKGINELNQYCLRAFQEYGLPYNPDYNGQSQIGVSPVQSTVGVMAQESLVPVITEEIVPGPRIRSDAEIGEWAKSAVTTMFHPVGTYRMGQDARAVVNARLRVRGVDGLRVIDASIMPNITSGNTSAPTQALARHAAAMLVEDMKRT
jgi:choline dehydrogenase-like flavoprotein